MNFYENLKSLRKAHGLTQVQLAKAVGVSPRLYQYIEVGKIKPNFDTLVAFADFYRLSIDDLIGRTIPQE